MFSPKRILVPTDFSEYADRALQYAVDVAEKYGGEILLLHIIGIIQQCTAGYCLSGDLMQQLDRESVSSSKEELQKQMDRGSATKGTVSTEIRKGIVYEEILKAQEETKSDLIVIASHGKTGLLHHLMGGVASKVIEGAKCPVLVVKP
jgi:universal stress protein A